MTTLARVLISIAIAIGLLAGATAYFGHSRWGDAYWYLNSQPDYRLACGQKAIREDNEDRASDIALLLEADGAKDHASLLRGEALFHRAKPYAESNDLTTAGPMLYKALGEFNKIRDKGVLRRQAATLMGQCFLYLHQPYEAFKAFNFVLSEDPNSITAHRGLGALYYDQGAMSRSIQHLDKWVELDPADGRPDRLAGLVLKDQKDYVNAIAYYERALNKWLPPGVRDQDPSRVRKELAECLVQVSNWKRALEVLEDIDPLPEDASAVAALRAESLIGHGRQDEAREKLDRALNLYPSNGDILRLRAVICLPRGEFAEASNLLERALLIDDHDNRSLQE